MNFLILLLNACGVHQDSPPPSDSSDTPPSTTGTTTYQDTQTKYDPDGDTYFEVDNAKALLAAIAKGSIIKDSVSADVLAHAQSAADEKLIDCNEQDSAVHPEIPEVCDGVDNNCDGLVDDSSSKDAKTFYADSDGDTFGSSNDTILACEQPQGYVANSTDECDNDALIVTPQTYYADADKDGYGTSTTTTVCASTAPAGYTTDASASDCNDTKATTNPGATEDETAIGDEDCSGQGIGNLSDRDAQYNGTLYSDLGASMANVGDMTGDGIPDTLVGAPGWTNSNTSYGPGHAYLLPGDAVKGWDTKKVITITGANDLDSAGNAIAAVGDLNGDGVDDVVIGADTRSNNTGSAYLITGPITGDMSLSAASHEWIGKAPDYAGSALAGDGDFNGDWQADLLISSPLNNDGGIDAGQVYLELGPINTGKSSLGTNDITFTGKGTLAYFGNSVAMADLDGDGFADVIVGSPNVAHSSPGEVYIFSGNSSPSASLTVANADSTLTGSTNGAEAGASVFAKEGADLDGDGLPDLLVGEDYNTCNGSESGAIYVVDNPFISSTLSTSAYAFICGERGSYLGWYPDGMDVGDQNNDGSNDLLLGAFGNGGAYLFKGPILGLKNTVDADQILRSETTGWAAGDSVKFLGDVDGDHSLEVGVSDTENNSGNKGSAYLVFGNRL